MKKGFTLIELLAVIVILSVIALIATPMIMNYVEDARDGALKTTARNIIEVAETEYTKQLAVTNHPMIQFADLKYSGEKIEDGALSFDDDGLANLAIYKDNKCVYRYAGEEILLDKTLTKAECLAKVGGNAVILVKNIDYKDDHYLFSGEAYYLNPYDLDMKCQSGATNANENKNECMKWYEISEDDKYVTLLLNSNLGEPLEDTSTITETMISYLNTLTSNWDSRLSFPDNTMIDGYDFSNAKARVLSTYEIANLMENPNWDKDSLDFDWDAVPYLKENLDFESWYHGGFFTLTPYDETLNYVVNQYGLDTSVADSYSHGVRPVIVIEKKYLDTYHNQSPKRQNLVTYLSGRMITSDDNATEEAIRYQVGKMRAAGIKRAFLDAGRIELVSTESGISLENELESIYRNYQGNMGKWMKIANEYGVEIVPWLNYSMERSLFETSYDENQTWGDVAIQALVDHVEKIVNTGYFYDGTYYKPEEIHYDAEPTRESYQPYYLQTIQAMRNAMTEETNFSVATAAGEIYSKEFFQTLSQYVDEMDVMTYDSMGPEDGEVKTQNDYIRYIEDTIHWYKSGLTGTDTQFFMIGPMYEDTYRESETSWPNDDGRRYYHMNFYQSEEIETMRVFIRAIKEKHQENINGIGFYNWNSFTYKDAEFNHDTYITEDYNQKTVVDYILKNWVY